MFAFGKNKELLKKLETYFGVVRETLKTLDEAMSYCLNNGIDEHFHTLAVRTHQHESQADDIRRSIELDLYKKSLLPESRQDLFGIIEMIDRIPNCGESIVNMIISQRMVPDTCIKKELLELIKVSTETTEYVLEAAIQCFNKASNDKVSELNRRVDDNETLGDHLELKMIAKIFDSKLGTGHKILQRDLVKLCGDICDLCEHAMDLITITSIKRQI